MLKSHDFVTLGNNNNHTKVAPYLEVFVNAMKANHFYENPMKVKNKNQILKGAVRIMSEHMVYRKN